MAQGPAADERVEVVDADGEVVDVVPRWRMRRDNLRHHAVFIAVLAADGRVLVHRRSDAKDVWPGWWDLAVGGVVTAGEGWDEAARRELAEELGVDGVEPEPWGAGTFEDASVRLVGRVYRLVHDGPFAFRDGEVAEAAFVSVAELRARLARDRFLPDSCALVLPRIDPPSDR